VLGFVRSNLGRSFVGIQDCFTGGAYLTPKRGCCQSVTELRAALERRGIYSDRISPARPTNP
jgi:hypothetical protein